MANHREKNDQKTVAGFSKISIPATLADNVTFASPKEEKNPAAIAFLAKVSIPEALAFDSQNTDHDPENPDTWDTLSAAKYDHKKHGHMTFYCPDCYKENGVRVRLKRPSGEFFQTISYCKVNLETGEIEIDENNEPVLIERRYKIPPRYTLFPGQEHGCSLIRQQAAFSQWTKDQGGSVDSHNGTYTFNLNIPAGQKILYPPADLLKDQAKDDFNQANADEVKKIPRTKRRRSAPQSHGIKTIEDLAGLLDATKFGVGRDLIFLKIGPQKMPLSEIYFNNSIEAYRALYSKEIHNKDPSNRNQIALFRFKPNLHRKYWKYENMGAIVIPSQAEQITDKHGRKYYVTTHLRLETPEIHRAFTEALKEMKKNKQKSFLIYSERAHVNLLHHQDELDRVDKMTTKHANVHVKAGIFTDKQFTQWPVIPRQIGLFSAPAVVRKGAVLPEDAETELYL